MKKFETKYNEVKGEIELIEEHKKEQKAKISKKITPIKKEIKKDKISIEIQVLIAFCLFIFIFILYK